MNIWNIFIQRLLDYNIDTIFGMVGDGEGLLEAAASNKNFTISTFRDQRSAIAAAVGFAQESGKIAIFAASAGPGIINTLMGLSEAYSMCVPLLIVSNGVSRTKKGMGAFQELDTIQLVSGITKWAYRIEAQDSILWSIDRGLYMAINGRPGPVFIEVPNDLIFLEDEIFRQPIHLEKKRFLPEVQELNQVVDELIQAHRPLFIAGGGAKTSGADQELAELVSQIPGAVFTSASGRGVFNERHPLALGLMGLYLTPPAEELLKKTDLVFFIGSQIEETILIGVEEYLQTKNIQLNIAPEDIGKSLPFDLGIIGDAKCSLQKINQLLSQRGIKKTNNEWISEIGWVKQEQQKMLSSVGLVNTPVRAVYRSLSNFCQKKSSIVLDNGMHDMWGYFYPVLNLPVSCQCHTPGEQTGLGLAVGVAVGAKQAQKDKFIVAVVGDGSLHLGKSALYGAAEQRLGVTLIVINNGGFSWPRIAQNKMHINIGCDFTIAESLQNLANELNAFYHCISPMDDCMELLNQASTENAQGRIALLEVQTDWNKDIPIGIINNYMGKQGEH